MFVRKRDKREKTRGARGRERERVGKRERSAVVRCERSSRVERMNTCGTEMGRERERELWERDGKEIERERERWVDRTSSDHNAYSQSSNELVACQKTRGRKRKKEKERERERRERALVLTKPLSPLSLFSLASSQYVSHHYPAATLLSLSLFALPFYFSSFNFPPHLPPSR